MPKPSRGSRTASLVFSNLPASQGAITRLENRWTRKGLGGSNPSSSASKQKTALKLRRFFFRSKTADACLFYPSFIPTVSKTVRPERAAVWKTSTYTEPPRIYVQRAREPLLRVVRMTDFIRTTSDYRRRAFRSLQVCVRVAPWRDNWSSARACYAPKGPVASNDEPLAVGDYFRVRCITTDMGDP